MYTYHARRVRTQPTAQRGERPPNTSDARRVATGLADGHVLGPPLAGPVPPVYMCVCIYLYIYIYIYMFSYIYIYVYSFIYSYTMLCLIVVQVWYLSTFAWVCSSFISFAHRRACSSGGILHKCLGLIGLTTAAYDKRGEFRGASLGPSVTKSLAKRSQIIWNRRQEINAVRHSQPAHKKRSTLDERVVYCTPRVSRRGAARVPRETSARRAPRRQGATPNLPANIIPTKIA